MLGIIKFTTIREEGKYEQRKQNDKAYIMYGLQEMA